MCAFTKGLPVGDVFLTYHLPSRTVLRLRGQEQKLYILDWDCNSIQNLAT